MVSLSRVTLLPVLVVLLLLFLLVQPLAAKGILKYRRSHALPHRRGARHGKFRPGPWSYAHATFYGGPDGSDTRAGACGLEDTVNMGYGLQTAAVSTALFNDGQICGACYEIKCVNGDKWCKLGQPSIFVTATNLCPPNFYQSSDNGGWCNPPRVHFDLSQPAYLQIAEYQAGIVPVQYRRVPCKKQGGIRFTINGNPWYTQILVWNVAGAGEVKSVLIKGNKLRWTPLRRDWGQRWVTTEALTGQSLTFRVTTSDQRKSTSWHITPRNWQFGQTYEGKNFKF